MKEKIKENNLHLSESVVSLFYQNARKMTITAQIAALESQLTTAQNQYAAKSIKEKISWLKAEEKGQFVTVDQLKELKPYIVWMINHCNFYKNDSSVLREAMTRLMNTKIIYRTTAGIKGQVAAAIKDIVTDMNTELFVKFNGEEYLTNSSLRATCPKFRRLQDFNFDVKK